VIILSEPHLQQVVAEYALSYFNTARPQQGIDQRIPLTGECVRTRLAGPVTAIPVLSGAASRLPRGGMTTADHEKEPAHRAAPIATKSARARPRTLGRPDGA
jgi:hypothetical protein